MKIYFEEITYDGSLVLWEVDDQKDIAIATHVIIKDKDNKFVVKIDNMHSHKLSYRSSSIHVNENENNLKIIHLADFLQNHTFRPIVFEEEITTHESKKENILETKSETTSSKSIPNRGSRSLTAGSPLDMKLARTMSEPILKTFFTFSLEKMITENKLLWGTTLCFHTLPQQVTNELDYAKSHIFMTDKMLSYIKNLESSMKVTLLKQKRIQILTEIVDKFFNQVLEKQQANKQEYETLSKQILLFVSNASSNERLEDLLDHEKENKTEINTESNEYIDLMEASRNIEMLRAKVIVKDFALDNLPDYFKGYIQKHLADEYKKLYQQLLLNVIDTGKQLRAGKQQLEKFKKEISEKGFSDPNYIAIDDIITRLIPDNNIPSSATKLVRHLSSANFHKKPPVIPQSSSPAKETLKNKIVETLVECWVSLNSSRKEGLKPKASFISAIASDKFFIKKEFADDFEYFLKRELKIDYTEGFKQVLKNIEDSKQKNLVDALKQWISSPVNSKQLSL